MTCLSERGYPRTVEALAAFLNIPQLSKLLACFIHDQNHRGAPLADTDPTPPCPMLGSSICVYKSAIATFHAPSDISGVSGMRRERIRATPSWRSGPARYDCVFAEKDPSLLGFRGLHVARVRLFFTFKVDRKTVPCALVEWFSPVGEEPDEDTGMWVVEPDVDEHGNRILGIVHLDAILRCAHLVGVAGSRFLPHNLHFSDSLDAFDTFYVNKYADHHAHEVAF